MPQCHFTLIIEYDSQKQDRAEVTVVINNNTTGCAMLLSYDKNNYVLFFIVG